MQIFQPMDLFRLRRVPERGVGLVLYVSGEDLFVWFEGQRKKFRMRPDILDPASREEVTDPKLLEILDQDLRALAGIPMELHSEIRRRWYVDVLHARMDYERAQNLHGRDGQKELSAFLKDQGITDTDPRWKTVIENGRRLYYLRTA
jgi:hypothetical protein